MERGVFPGINSLTYLAPISGSMKKPVEGLSVFRSFYMGEGGRGRATDAASMLAYTCNHIALSPKVLVSHNVK